MWKLNVFVAVSAAGVAAAGVGTTAMAGSSLCPASQVCLYANNNFSGLLGYRGGGQRLLNMSSAANDKMDSWENKSGSNARWYHNSNGGGRCVTMSSRREDSNIAVWDSDRASSWATNGAC